MSKEILWQRVTERLMLVSAKTAETNRMKSYIRRFGESEEFSKLLKDNRRKLATLIRQKEGQIAELAEQDETCQLLRRVVGIASWQNVAVIAARVKNVERFKSVSAIWRFNGFGIDPETGKIDKRQRGKKLHFDPICQVAWWQMSIALIRPGGPWRGEYLRILAFEQAKQKKYAGKRAIRKVVKEILKRFYVLGTKRDWKPCDSLKPNCRVASMRQCLSIAEAPLPDALPQNIQQSCLILESKGTLTADGVALLASATPTLDGHTKLSNKEKPCQPIQ